MLDDFEEKIARDRHEKARKIFLDHVLASVGVGMEVKFSLRRKIAERRFREFPQFFSKIRTPQHQRMGKLDQNTTISRLVINH